MIACTIAGRKILITRAADDALGWAERLQALGALPVILPCLVAVPNEDDHTRTLLRDALRDATWLVVSSPRGAELVARLTQGTFPAHVRIAAVGPTTARAARDVLGRVDLVPKEMTSAGLGGELAGVICADAGHPAPHVMVAGAEGGRDDAERALVAAGHRVTRVDIYKTVPAPVTAVKRDLGAEGIDDVLLASPSAVTGLLNCTRVPPEMRIVTIGSTTSAAAVAAGLRVTAEARRPDLESMIEVMS